MSRKYRKEREMKTTSRNPHPPELQRYLDKLSPKRLWEVCKPIPIFLKELSEEEQLTEIQNSRIAVFELLSRRFGLGVLELREDTLHPLGLKLD